ncbi:MAG: metallophosphoesterase [Bacteroidetes bacterium]|nr:MAG: metallophosphoesterase [Bacteroidota bacterium]
MNPTRILPFLIPLAFLLLVDFYFFQLVRTAIQELSPRLRLMVSWSYWLVSAGLLMVLLWSSFQPTLPNHQRYFLFSVLLVVLIPKLVGVVFLFGEDLFRLGNGVVGHFKESDEPFLRDRRKFIAQAGLVTAALPFASMIYGMLRTAYNIQVRRKTVFFEDLPASFDGMTIAQISDVHSGSFSSSNYFQRAIDTILGLKPDVIFFTGDLVNNEAVEFEPHLNVFGQLKAPLGVFSILGNHDYGDYGPWPSAEAKTANLQRLKAMQQQAGWDLLLNEHRIIERNGERIAIIGVENWGASRHFPKKGDLDKAVQGAESVPFKLLLSHDPSHWEAKVKDHPQHFHLTLSGHTHGAQFGIEIPGIKWSPAKYIYKQWAGLYEDGEQKIYVNRGLGFIGYMGRIGISPEITLLELRKKEKIV